MHTIKLEAADGKKISVNVWDEVENKKSAIYISHGMAEHADRYNDFATFLNGHGYIVLADDHRGHRNNPFGAKGIVEGDSFADTMEDIKLIVDYIKTTYKLDVAIIGHSYGSFLVQRFLEKYGASITHCVLSGTAYIKTPLMRLGLAISGVQKFILGEKATSKLIDKLSFGAYNKPFAAEGKKFSWLSRDPKQVDDYENDEDCGYPLSVGFYNSFFKNAMRLYGEGTATIPKKLPIFIAVGSNDPVSANARDAKKLYDYYKKEGLNVYLHIYEGARHGILNETNKEEVYNDMLEFISR